MFSDIREWWPRGWDAVVSLKHPGGIWSHKFLSLRFFPSISFLMPESYQGERESHHTVNYHVSLLSSIRTQPLGKRNFISNFFYHLFHHDNQCVEEGTQEALGYIQSGGKLRDWCLVWFKKTCPFALESCVLHADWWNHHVAIHLGGCFTFAERWPHSQDCLRMGWPLLPTLTRARTTCFSGKLCIPEGQRGMSGEMGL